MMRRHIRHTLGAASTVLLLSACSNSTSAPLSPPSDGLALSLHDAPIVGEMTWVGIARPATDTGETTSRSKRDIEQLLRER